MTIIFSARKICFAYKDRTIFEDADFQMEAGDRIGLLSPNGSGKTTLFKIFTGLLKAEGDIVFLGEERSSEADFQALRRELGFVLQNADDQLFFPEVIEDVAFGPLNLGRSREEALRDSEEALAQVGLSHLKHALSFELSGGQKKLVALASVLSMRPSCCFLMSRPQVLTRRPRKPSSRLSKN